MDSINQILSLISGIFSGDLVTIILKLVLGLGITVALIFIVRWLNKKLIDAAHQKTKEGRARDQADLEQENRDVFSDAQRSEEALDKILKGQK